jgi:hypothetical protein
MHMTDTHAWAIASLATNNNVRFHFAYVSKMNFLGTPVSACIGTMQRIAKALNVSQATISEDLRSLEVASKPSRAKVDHGVSLHRQQSSCSCEVWPSWMDPPPEADLQIVGRAGTMRALMRIGPVPEGATSPPSRYKHTGSLLEGARKRVARKPDLSPLSGALCLNGGSRDDGSQV